MDILARQLRVVFSEVNLLTSSNFWEQYFWKLMQAYTQEWYMKSGFADTYTQTLQPLYDQLIHGAQKELT